MEMRTSRLVPDKQEDIEEAMPGPNLVEGLRYSRLALTSFKTQGSPYDETLEPKQKLEEGSVP